MKINNFLHFSAATLFLVVVSAGAQQRPMNISLDQAIRIALDRNISVIQAENALEGQESNRRAAYGDFLPSLDASGRWSRSQSTSAFIPGAGLIPVTTTRTQNAFSTGLDASVVLFNGFGNTANLNRANASVRSAEESLSRTRQQIVYETLQWYLNVLRTRELVKVQEENLKRSVKQLERIVEANRVGAVAVADVYRQQVQASNDELALIQAQNNYNKANADLAFFLSLNVLEEYDFSDLTIAADIDTSELQATREKTSNIAIVVQRALELRPDYRSAIANHEGARSGVTVARAGHFPIISAQGSYGFRGEEFKDLRDNKNMSWGLSISLPLFNRFRTDNQLQQARVAERNAYEQLKQAERRVQVDVKKAALDLEAAAKQIEVTKKSVISAEQDRRIAEEKYNLGAGTLLDLLIANTNYVSAVSNKINSVYSYHLSKKQFEFVSGTLEY